MLTVTIATSASAVVSPARSLSITVVVEGVAVCAM